MDMDNQNPAAFSDGSIKRILAFVYSKARNAVSTNGMG
jgi:hypothetical protein